MRAELLNKISKPLPRQRMLVDNQTTADIVEAILAKHKKHLQEYDEICGFFDAGSVDAICRRLYNFCRRELPYNEETVSAQYTSSPQEILTRGYSDCKCYALFCGGVLDALKRRGRKINWKYRFASYRIFDPEPGHVFVVVKNGEKWIWLDPVINSYDYHKPFMWGEDFKIKMNQAQAIGKVGTCGSCQQVGCAQCATVNGAAAAMLISSVAPAASVIPVAGPFIQIGLQLAAMAAGFLKNYKSSEGVRWLTHLYEENVQGKNIDFSQVDENLTDESHNWFNAVFGVPIYDKFRYHTLTGTSPTTGQKLVPYPSEQQRANDYLKYWDAAQAQVTPAEALSAAQVGTFLPLSAGITGKYGAWAKQPVNAMYAAKLNAQQAGHQDANLRTADSGNANWLLIGAVVVGGYLLIKNKKRRHK